VHLDATGLVAGLQAKRLGSAHEGVHRMSIMTWEKILRHGGTDGIRQAAKRLGIAGPTNPLHVAGLLSVRSRVGIPAGITRATVRLLLELGCDPQQYDERGYTPGAIYCDAHRWDLLEELRLPINQPLTSRGKRALHYAAEAITDPLIVRTLARQGADPLVADAFGRRPLHLAVKDPLRSLFGLGAFMPAAATCDGHGRTALHYLAFHLVPTPSDLAAVGELIRHGCNPEQQDRDGNEAWELASDPALRDLLRTAAQAHRSRRERAVLAAVVTDTSMAATRRRM
jgi:hypothetical protein